MLLRYLSAAALALHSVNAFRDASPFVSYSTTKKIKQTPDANVLSAQKVQEVIDYQLKGCPSDTYVVVSQPGLSPTDLSTSKSTPHLRRRVSGNDDQVSFVFSVSNVVGEISAHKLLRRVIDSCRGDRPWHSLTLDGEKGELPTKAYNSIYLRFPELPVDKDQREDALLQADSFLNSLLNTLDSFTVFYDAVPSSAEPRLSQRPSSQHPEQYEMDEQYPANMHIDLKRDLESHIRRASNKSSSANPQANLALFEKYQFLSSGIFMGGAVSILLFSILYVGISAIAGLEVSYMAFSKETGPAAQKKQQQQ